MSTADDEDAARRPTAKGWCPGAYRPMRSGDGLIVRVRPRLGRLTLGQALGLCEAAARFGSGIIELTNRANLQLRGVREWQHLELVAALAQLGLVDDDPALEQRRNIVVAPLWRVGDDTERLATELAARLGELPPLPAKFGFAVDAGHVPMLVDTSADVRIERGREGGLIVRADGAREGVSVDPSAAIDVAIALSTWFATTGGKTRMKAHLVQHALPAALAPTTAPALQAALPLPGPTLLGPAYCVAFGQMAAASLEQLLRHCAAEALRVAPRRAVILENASWAASSEFITAHDDPLLDVDACPGAPACASATVETRLLARQLAPLLVGTARLGGPRTLHISGCAKGCARAQAADLTLVGRDGTFDIVRAGTARDRPSCMGVAPHALASIIGAD